MKTITKSTLAFSCLLGAFAVAGAASAGAMCMSTCNDRNLTCSASGRSDGACLQAWHQCKVACSGAAKMTPTRASPVRSPAPHVVKALART